MAEGFPEHTHPVEDEEVVNCMKASFFWAIAWGFSILSAAISVLRGLYIVLRYNDLDRGMGATIAACIFMFLCFLSRHKLHLNNQKMQTWAKAQKAKEAKYVQD